MTNPGWPFWSFSKRFSKFCLFTLQVNPSNLYRAEFDILFPFLPFVLFLRLCVHSCVCECIHRGIPYFDYPTSPTEANCPSHCTTSATGHRARKRFQRNPMEDSAPLCRFWRLAGCGVLPCLAVSIRTKRALIHCTATAKSGGLILQWCLRRSSAAFPTANPERMDRVRSSNYDP
jgi:hypothetical protein